MSNERPKTYTLQDYQVRIDLSPAKDVLGPYEVATSTGPAGENKLSIIKKDTGVAYCNMIIMELVDSAMESDYPKMVRVILERAGFAEPLMFYERIKGKVGLLTIAQKKEGTDKSYWFFFTVCPFARIGIIEGTNWTLASGLPLIDTIKMVDSISIKKLI